MTAKKKLIEVLNGEQLPPVNSSEIPNSSDTISRAKAIEALKAARVEDDGTYKWRTQRNLDLEFAAELLETIPPAPTTEVAIDINVGDKDTISRKAAIDALNNIEIPRNASWYQYYQQALTAVDKLPPAQPERIKGHWVEIALSNHTYKCSVCGRLLVNITDGKNNVAKNYPYCHCGADMRGEQDG